MTSRFDDRWKAHGIPVVNREFSVTVSLSRGGITTADFSARRAQREHESQGAEIGIAIKVELRDYTLPIASVVINNREIEPRAGDRIIEGDATWEVHQPDDSTPAAERLGEYEWVVHTRLVT